VSFLTILLGGPASDPLKYSPQLPEEVRSLAVRVADALGWPSYTVDARGLEIHDFSYGFRMSSRNETQADAVYVKLPRHDLLFCRDRPLFPRTAQDCATGAKEFESLSFLKEILADETVRFVEPRLHLIEEGAVVTTLASSQDAFHDIRRWDRATAGGSTGAMKALDQWLGGLGHSLRIFHEETDRGEGEVNLDIERSKILGYIAELGRYEVSAKRRTNWMERIQGLPAGLERARLSLSLKGIDVRNLVWNGRGRMVVLDPGAMKPATPEADLARFLLTLKILYWGDLSFAFGRRPGPATARAFLRGYGPWRESSRLNAWLKLKEVLKHWRMAWVAIELKSWPGFVKQIVGRTYVDPFYTEELEAALQCFDSLPRGPSSCR